uniref:Activin_recp domain-containing protein n=1 Tax=Heterorhabditis bacteriophora TaxID=37862 RepID=A0A1I7WMJ3_HETBA
MLFVLLLFLPIFVEGEVTCYHCYGNSSSQGQFCSINKLCTGESCYFREWSAGCSSSSAMLDFKCTLDGLTSNCVCAVDLCNQFKAANKSLQAFWPKESPFDKFNYSLPLSLSVHCNECGNISIAGKIHNVPCNEENTCLGNFCVTKRGQYTYSYCGTTWEGTTEARCFKNPGEEEQCVCSQQMCNVMLPPNPKTFNQLTTTTTPTTTPIRNLTKTKICKNGRTSKIRTVITQINYQKIEEEIIN